MADAPSDDPATAPSGGSTPQAPEGPWPGLKVALDLGSILEHCKCSICMGIVKNTRAVSACMHRFCKDCIEAWLRTQIENNCPQCRVKFSSKRDCKPDPNFDLLLGAMFGDIQDFEQRMLDPSLEVLERAKAVGHQIAMAKENATSRRPSPPLVLPRQQPRQELKQQQQALPDMAPLQQQQQVQQPPPLQQHPAAAAAAGDATVHVTVVARGRGHPGAGSKRGGGGAGGEGKRLKLSMGEDEDGGALQYRGVRFQGDNWQARTKRAGKELSLGLYNTAEEAGMAYDLDRLQQQGGKAQRLNFPLLRQHYKQILTDLADLHTPDGLLDFLAVAVQAAVKASRGVPGATAPENTGPAAASMLNPRRAIAPAVHVTGEPHLAAGTAAGAAAAAAAAAAGAFAESDYDELPPEAAAPPEPEAAVAPAEQHALADQRAEQLAVERPLEAGLAGGVAHVRLEAGSGLAWRMTYLGCPATVTIGEVSEAVALGLAQQHGLQAGVVTVGLAVSNDLDASADFDALCYEDAETGNLFLRSHVTIRELLRTLQDSLEDLALEYSTMGAANRIASPADGPAAATVVAAA